ncbi:unnamed protein product [Thlaspi arvense]|uniref:Uncharacterized protein n=1 Tax=Thlaspi arvense TaxID=13288 RepID=A0AAU9S3L3_THLAR|nr:unnamed protein product [Thlaspi arvense]
MESLPVIAPRLPPLPKKKMEPLPVIAPRPLFHFPPLSNKPSSRCRRISSSSLKRGGHRAIRPKMDG